MMLCQHYGHEVCAVLTSSRRGLSRKLTRYAQILNARLIFCASAHLQSTVKDDSQARASSTDACTSLLQECSGFGGKYRCAVIDTWSYSCAERHKN